jgi:hypothetical protein
VFALAEKSISPTVEDLLDQVRDFFEILKGVEQAVAGDGSTAVECAS